MTIERDHDKILEEQEFSKTMTYFIELEDALSHYSSCLPKGMFMTLTVRTDESGKAVPQLITETKFPPLDDLYNHFEKLKLAASELDRLPKSYWEDLYDHQLGTKKGQFPHIPLQIVLWGLSPQEAPFIHHAEVYEIMLNDFPWTEDPVEDIYRDHAEQCFRIAYSYLEIAKTGVIPEHKSPNIDTPT